MRELTNAICARAKELLQSGAAGRVLGWAPGEFFYDPTPGVFSEGRLNELVYDGFTAANLSKYCIAESQKEGKVLVLLKPCDSYSLAQLVKEHRVKRENIYALGIPCEGKLDMRKARAKGVEGALSFREEDGQVVFETLYGEVRLAREELLLERCLCCRGREYAGVDETLEYALPELPKRDRFQKVAALEEQTAQERYAFWRGELSKCIRCNACRNVCPACSCVQCVFDNPQSGVAAKANSTEFEESLFHIIRAWHVAGRCTDCGECSRVCPQSIPLHLLNRKFIKDVNELYGEYQAGADPADRPPLVNYTPEDPEPSAVLERGRA